MINLTLKLYRATFLSYQNNTQIFPSNNNTQIVPSQVTTNNQILISEQPVSDSTISNLEKVCKELDPTPTSFSESLPNYDSNEDIILIKAVKGVFRFFIDLSTEQRDAKQINEEIENNLLTKDNVIEKIPEELNSEIVKVYSNLSEYKPLGQLGEYTLNETIIALSSFNTEFISNIGNLEITNAPLKWISAGLLLLLLVFIYY